MYLDPIITRKDGASAQQQDYWILSERYSESLPIYDETEGKTPAPPYTPYELPLQVGKKQRKFDRLKEYTMKAVSNGYEFLTKMKRAILAEKTLQIIILIWIFIFFIAALSSAWKK